MNSPTQPTDGFETKIRWLLSVYFLLLVVYGSISIAGWEDLSLAVLTGRKAWLWFYPLLTMLHLILCYQLVQHRYVRWVWYLMMSQAIIIVCWGVFDIASGWYDRATDETAFSLLLIAWGSSLIAFGMMSLFFIRDRSTRQRFAF